MLFQIEIICFFTSFAYILFYISDRFYLWYKKKATIEKEKIERQKVLKEKQKSSKKKIEKQASKDAIKSFEKKLLSSEQNEKVREITKRAQINVSRWYYESARSLIIEWLAIKKDDRELNILLADIYEREKKYKNAEYIYKDMLEAHEDDEYLLQRLWNIYALLWKNKKSFETYQKALTKDRSNTEILDIISHLGLEIGDYKKSHKYACLYLKQKPRNAEKLGIKWFCLEKMWRYDEAVKSYKQVLQVQPYNTEIQDRIKELEK